MNIEVHKVENPITKEEFLEDANKCWNDVLKKNMTDQEKAYAWTLLETEFLSRRILTKEALHKKSIEHLSKDIILNGISIFNWVMSRTYKNFNLGSIKKSN